MSPSVRRFLLVLLLTGFSLSLFAIDFGGSVDNATTLAIQTGEDIEQRNKLSLWIDHNFADSSEFLVIGNYTFSLDDPYTFDLERLQVKFKITPQMPVIVGRFGFTEFSGIVLNHPLDGFWFTYNFPRAVISAGVGYSGLQFSESNQIVMSQSDTTDFDDPDFFLGSPRIIEALHTHFPELFGRQDVMVSLLFQQDLRPQSQLLQEGEEIENAGGLSGGKLHSFYLGLGLSGPISSSAGLYYDTFLYTETGTTLSYIEDSTSSTGFSYQYEPILAFLGGLNVDYYSEKRAYSKIGLSLLFASGDSDSADFQEGNTAGRALQFTPISRPSFGLIFSPQIGNIFIAKTSFSMKPFSNSSSRALQHFQTELRLFNYLRPTVSPISEAGIDQASDALSLGSELDGVVRFRPFSDLGTALSMGVFLPSEAAFSGENQGPRFLGRFEFSFSF